MGHQKTRFLSLLRVKVKRDNNTPPFDCFVIRVFRGRPKMQCFHQIMSVNPVHSFFFFIIYTLRTE